jgi:hypothetical protein
MPPAGRLDLRFDQAKGGARAHGEMASGAKVSALSPGVGKKSATASGTLAATDTSGASIPCAAMHSAQEWLADESTSGRKCPVA